MRNNKGFTLVELLVTMAILGIVTMMTFPLIRNITNSNDKSKYSSYLEGIVSGAKLYVDSYAEDMFGRDETGCDVITFNDLYSHNLVKDFDMNGITCNTTSTFVEVKKVGSKYTYTGYLGCVDKSDTSKLVYSLPNNGEENHPSGSCVGVDNTGTINFGLESNNSSSFDSRDYKVRSLRVVMRGEAGINAGFNIFYGFSSSPDGSDITDWKRLSFGKLAVSDEQKRLISTGQGPITTRSSFVDTPQGLTGKYYLVIKTNDLMDLYAKKWTNVNNSDTLALGPVTLDNTAPVFGGTSSILSTVSGYNGPIPKLALSVSDNYSLESELKMCVSYSEYCNPSESYNSSKTLSSIPGFNYNGNTHNVYVSVMDKAGNVAQKTLTYTAYKHCDHTKENSAAITCENISTTCSQFCGSEGVKIGEEYIGLVDSHFTNVSCGKKYRSTCSVPCNRNVSCTQGVLIYEFGNILENHCDSSSDIRIKYEFEAYYCNCDFNTDGSLNYSTSTSRNVITYDDSTINFNHSENHYGTVHYFNNDNGRKACNNTSGYPRNSYVEQVCANGDYATSSDSQFGFHGVTWYRNNSAVNFTFNTNYWFQKLYRNGGAYRPGGHSSIISAPIINKTDYPNPTGACRATCANATNKQFFVDSAG